METIPETKGKKKLFLFLIVIMFNLVAFGSLAWWAKNQIDILEECDEKVVYIPESEEIEDDTFFEVNYHSYSPTDDPTYAYQTFQLSFPSKYVVTTGEMWDPYDTQGGIGQPKLIFTKGRQPLGNISMDDFIYVYVFNGITSIEDWDDTPFFDSEYELVSEDEKELDNFTLYKKTLSINSQDEDVYVAYLFLPEKVSYYFRTKGDIDEGDFYSIVESIKIRAYVDWGF